MKFDFRRAVFWVATAGFSVHFLMQMLAPRGWVTADMLMGLGFYLLILWLNRTGRLDRFNPEHWG
jgi:hypothetical protein